MFSNLTNKGGKMKKYKCPYCENDSYSFFSKMFAGGMASRGTACPKCGKHAVHGMKSTIFSTVMMALALIFIIINYNSASPSIELCLCVLAGAFLICKIANALFFPLTENNRRDVR